MKVIILLVFITLVSVSCSNKEDMKVSSDLTFNANDSNRTYVDSKGTTLYLSNSIWHTSKEWGSLNVDGFVTVYIVLSGSTNADKVTVRTSGDGVITDQSIILDSKKSFNKDTVGITFSHFTGTPPSEEFERNTVIKAYKGSDTLVVTMNSGKLKY